MVQQCIPIYEFGPFVLDLGERLLLKNGQAVPLTPKIFDTLCVLVQNSGHVLDKGDLMKTIWPDSFVEEVNLAHNISVLRKLLGEDNLIETVPKRGYRFAARVSEVSHSRVLIDERVRSSVTIEEEAIKADDSIRTAWLRQNARPKMLVAVVVLAGLATGVAYFSSSRSPKPSSIKSIAVLPFKPVAAESRDESFEMGMADTLITKLSNLREIRVRPISAVRKYAGVEQDPVAAGRELAVDAVVDGSIQWDGNRRIRVTVRLISVRDGSLLWTNKCEEQCTDIFAVQDSISEKVAGALAPKLTGEERQLFAKHYTDNTEAYQLYVKGRYFWNKRTEEALKKGTEYFEQAIEKDSNYALAYSGLADCYIVLGSWRAGGALSPKEAGRRARAAAAKALEIDSSLAEAHTSLADAELLYGWDWLAVEREFKRAIELNPNYATAHQWYANYLMAMGRLDEAIIEVQRAKELNLVSLIININLGEIFRFARQEDRAIEQYQRTLELDPNFAEAHADLGKAYEQKAMYADAIAEFKKAITLSKENPLMVAALGRAYAVSGQAEEAKKILDELKKISKRRYVSSYEIAVIYAGLGDKDKALEWLERAYEERASFLIFLKVDPRLDSLRPDPRFQDLLRRMGLAS
jgi:TolB-like protein/DNA-binding winged helix-turn-helix (wHTH) protein/Tfp pilus assembly protein PilF